MSTTGDDPWTRTAKVSFGGAIKEVNLGYVPEAKVDDYVIVHAGFALSQIDEAEAVRMFEELSRLAEFMGDAEESDTAPSPGQNPTTGGGMNTPEEPVR